MRYTHIYVYSFFLSLFYDIKNNKRCEVGKKKKKRPKTKADFVVFVWDVSLSDYEETLEG